MGLDKVKETTFRAARDAGALLKERLGKIKDVDYKGAFNIVTDVDRASEQLIIDILLGEFPSFAILAEEGGAKNSGAQCRWLIDPLDGTTNYTHAYPFFSVSIGLEDSGRMVFGVVYNPLVDELFWAQEGEGAWLNDVPISVSQNGQLKNCLLATGFPPDTRHKVNSNMRQFSTLTDICHGVRRDGSAALDLCFVACGRLDGFWEMKLSPWDTAAGSLIVEEAGGKVTNLAGGCFDMTTGHILATNELIHDGVVEVLQQLASEHEDSCSVSERLENQDKMLGQGDIR